MKKVIIIGGGASGLVCASKLKMLLGNSVSITICERLEKVGKKILATGNGKCNFTNSGVAPSKYNDQIFVKNVLDNVTYLNVVNYFKDLGMLSKEMSEGRIYPYSETATSVLEVLRMNLTKNNVEIRNNYEVDKVIYKNNKYQVFNHNQRNYFLECDYIVFCCGGSSCEILGSNGSGYKLLKPFKIKTTSLTPGLVGLKSDDQSLKVLNGLRFKAMVKVYNKKTKKVVFNDQGEVQFKNDGISGICVMQASSFIARNPGSYSVMLDFLPDLNENEVLDMLINRTKIFNDVDISNFFSGFFPKMLGSIIIKKAGIDLSCYVSYLTKQDLKKLVSQIKNFTINITGNYGFDKSQVTVGGIELSEIDSATLALRKMNNAYICGEMMNIDGDCGGYNLDWAFASAIVVADHIAKDVLKNA